jgi:hypothetical protein
MLPLVVKGEFMAENYLLKEAHRIATEMLKENKTTAPITTWGDGKTLFVSIDKDAIYSTEVIKVEECKIFIGTLLRDHKK